MVLGSGIAIFVIVAAPHASNSCRSRFHKQPKVELLSMESLSIGHLDNLGSRLKDMDP